MTLRKYICLCFRCSYYPCHHLHLIEELVSLCLKFFLQKEVKDEQKIDAEMSIKASIGFRHVIDLLSSEKKLIVGHNCFLGMNISLEIDEDCYLSIVSFKCFFHCDTDIAHIYSKFFGPLPLTAEEFISSVNKYFPHIIDTKILLNSNSILQQRMKKSSTSLSKAFSVLCPQIALGSKSTHLSLQPSVKVEVEVDDTRFVFSFFPMNYEVDTARLYL